MKCFLEETLDKLKIKKGEYGERITVFGFSGMLIEGHKGLCDYSRECVKIKLKKRSLSVTGKEITINEISHDEIFLCGKISGMEVINDK